MKSRKTNESASLKEQALGAIRVLEIQIRSLNTQIRLGHRSLNIESIQTLWTNKQKATKHLMVLKTFATQ